MPQIDPINSSISIAQPLAQSGLAGSYDFVRVNTGKEFISYPSTTRHESVHALIGYWTVDGQTARMLARSEEERRLQNLALPSLSPLIQNLIDSSRVAQESFATYLGVKSLCQRSEKVALLDNSDDYSEYFEKLSGPLDGFFKSTFLQYLIAFSLVEVVFASPLVKRIVTLPLDSDLELFDYECPDWRFARVLEILTPDLLTELFQDLQSSFEDFCQASHISRWDLQCEKKWIDNVSMATEVEFHLSPIATAFFRRRSNLPCLDQGQALTALQSLARQLLPYGVLFETKYQTFSDPKNLEETRSKINEQIRFDAAMLGNSRVSNNPVQALPKNSKWFREEGVEWGFKIEDFQIVAPEPGRGADDWYFAGIPHDPSGILMGKLKLLLVSASMEDLLRWTTWCLRNGDAYGLSAKLDAVTIGVESMDEVQGWETRINKLLGAGWYSNGQPSTLAASTVWYWCGNIIDLAESLAAGGGFHGLAVEDMGADDYLESLKGQGLPYKQPDFCTHILQSRNDNRVFVKAMPFDIAMTVAAGLSFFHNNGHASPFPVGRERPVADLALRAALGLRNFWYHW